MEDRVLDILYNRPDHVLDVLYDIERRRRILLVRRDDGGVHLWYGQWMEPSDFQPVQRCDEPTGTVCSTLEIARREALGNYPWARSPAERND